MGPAVWQWMLPQVSGRVTTVGIRFHMFARSHSRRFQTSQVGQLLCLFLYVNVRAVLTYAIGFFPPQAFWGITAKTLHSSFGSFSRPESDSVFSVKMMHHKQLSFFAAFSFIHEAFPSSVPPFVPCLFQTSTARVFSHMQLKVWNRQLYLRPFSCCFKPISLAVGVYEHKMELAWGLDQTV